MKKVIFILSAMLLISINTFGQIQTERKTLFKSKFGYEIKESITGNDTLVNLWSSYQNQKYSRITDIGYVSIYKRSEAKVFAEKLIEFSQKEKGTELNYRHPEFILLLFDFTESIYIYDKKQMKYTSISKKKAAEMGEEILSKLSILKE
jgi:hypothetical protein